LAAAQCRPVSRASSRLRLTVGTVSISSTLARRQRSHVCYGCTFAPFGSWLVNITIKDPSQATSTGLCRITPGDPAPAIACHSTIVSSHRAGCSIRAKLLLPPGALWLSSHTSFFPLISLLLIPFFFAPFYRALSALKGPDSELRLRLIHRMISSQLISLT
jgi:hypothetical protein